MPKIPGRAGGAGIGSLIHANKKPTIRPATTAKIISCIIIPSFAITIPLTAYYYAGSGRIN